MASPSRQTEPIAFEPGWTSLSGRILSGGFELQEILAADEWQANLKVRVLGDRELDCVIHCFRLPQSIADQQVAIWQATRELRHPNLSAPLGAGTLEIEGECAAYVVVRRADESLNTVLAERALTTEETREALGSVVCGLEALHSNGLAHGCLSPSQVLAVGEAIKLPVGCVRQIGVPPSLEIQKAGYLAPESSGENLTAEADLWCLGATVYEALTQQVWTGNKLVELQAIPEPFATIASRCLEDKPSRRGSLEEVNALLSGKLKPPPRVLTAPAPVSAPASVAEREVAAESHSAESSSVRPRIYVEGAAGAAAINGAGANGEVISPSMAGMVIPEQAGEPQANRSLAHMPTASSAVAQTARVLSEAVPTVSPASGEDVRPILVSRPRWEDVVGHQSADQQQEHSSTNLWVWAVAALLVVVGLIWTLRPKTGAETKVVAPVTTAGLPKKPTAENVVSTGIPSNGKSATNGMLTKPAGAWETRTLQPDGSAPRVAAAVPPAKSTLSSAAGQKPAVEPWRLILYTYHSQEDARRKAASLNNSHGSLHCEVFSPSGSGSPYLVVAGGRMSRDQAAQFRRRALSFGMPHDSYIQNYKH